MTHEEELIRKMGQGDRNAANKLIETFYPEILRYCLWHAPNRSLAEDATQETFLKVIRYFDSYIHKGKFKAFLYRIAANTCIDMQRKNRPSDVSVEELEVDISYTENGFDEIQEDMILQQLVCELPENSREIVILKYGQDLTMREIAEILGIPLRTVQTRLRSALKQIKEKVEKEKSDEK